ncbi:ATP-dependent zinc metalloprotease FtsH [Limobrevibacterium gyesilva]|uniref:ATP-dependent zinc metalloprotease FtsH n=1 Tax=Limobrevibacterium gyesilva TaxID=2991712 RepID=A0AA41YV47_9PROT|nr:ATP-dependent zinc metalloprotease FtsH [Limobrevibacterium gyesilva]MCW3477113.1 ATP-dependent zinc metalloprotease FtsH [Limobrevibacterium gyesilva]
MTKLPLIQIGWAIALALVLLSLLNQGGGGNEPIPYSRFQQLLDDGRVAKVTVAGDTIRGEYKEKQADGTTGFTTQRVPADLAGQLAKTGVEFAAVPATGPLGTLLGWVLPPLLFVGVWLGASYFMSGGRGGFGGGLLSVGRSRAKLVAETDVKVSFDDVAGVDEAKEELHEIVEFLKKPQEFGRLGAHIPRGILLVGPPGTGKTLLARAVAGEAGVPFFSTNGAEFVEMFVGVGAARVRDLFEQARKLAPCIIFIDELDALGRARGASPITGQDEKEQTLNQLLAEMDGFDRSVAIVILAATNRPEILDPALLRAGRFDRQVLVDRPEKKGRVQILRVHLKNLKLAPDVDLDAIAALTPGFTGADLANLANEAAVRATRRGADAIAMEDFAEAVERIVAGLEKRSRVLIPRERRIVAFHEMGHALVAMAIPGTDPVQKISIIPRGIAALGYTMQHPTEDRFLMGQHELEARMAVLMGGRAAETLIGPDVSTGAADDLAKATDIARGMVLRFGMDPKLGPVAWDTEQGRFLDEPGAFWRPRRFSDATSHEIDDAVRTLLQRSLERALAILRDNRAVLDSGAETLLARESLAGDEIPRPKPERPAG